MVEIEIDRTIFMYIFLSSNNNRYLILKINIKVKFRKSKLILSEIQLIFDEI